MTSGPSDGLINWGLSTGIQGDDEIMKRILLIIASALLLTSCGICKKVVVQKDSTRVEVRDRIVYVHDTMTVNLPAERESIVTDEQHSHLENSVAVSDASVDSLGRLHHSLESKGSVNMPVDVPYHYRDSTVYVEREKEVQVPVEKRLTRWQEFRLKWFGTLVAVLLLCFAWILRKPLKAVLTKII